MGRSNAAWFVSLPLSAIGLLLAHEFAWGFASHEHEARASHGYLQYAALFTVLAVAAALVAATVHLVRAVATGDVAKAPSARVFAAVPLTAFVLQEHAEHVLRARELEISHFASTPFVVGLLLQLPFALAALFVARLILGFVGRLARAVRSQRAAAARESLRIVIPLARELTPRPALATHSAGRAPPASR